MPSRRDKLIANIDAIETALKLGKDTATPDQREILKQYAGFGDLKCILLDPTKPDEFSKSEQPFIPLVQRLHDVIQEHVPNQFDSFFASLKASVLTSFYTPDEIVSAMSDSFSDNRYQFGHVLDPSAGMGAFCIMKGDTYTLIEKELVTSKILTALHPDKKVISGGFEDIPARMNNRFNLVASNIPFGDFRVFDASYLNSKDRDLIQSTNAIHTYFFEKGLDTLRNGGILAFIAPTGVMDARKHEPFRQHLLSRAALVSTVRLPENTFDSTKAQSDLIILQKNTSRNARTPLSPFEQRFVETIPYNNIFVNSLYANSGERIAATQSRFDTNMYGQPDIRHVYDGGVSEIANTIKKIIADDIRNHISRKLFLAHNQTETSTAKPLQFSLFDDFFNAVEHVEEPKSFEVDNKIYDAAGCFQVSGDDIGISDGEGTASLCDEQHEDRKQLIRDYVYLRDAYFNLKSFENEYLRENSEFRAALNKAYENFVNSPYSKFLDEPVNFVNVKPFFVSEPSYTEIRGLEYFREGKVAKADIFFEPVAFGREKDVYTPQEALHICRNRYNTFNMDYMVSLTRLDESEIVKQLQGQIYKNPVSFRYDTADVFLSGNVIEKYEHATLAFSNNPHDHELKESRDALMSIIPAKIPFHEIGITLGERWIPVDYFSAFASHIFQVWDVHVTYNGIIDQFDVNCRYHSYYASEKYSVQTANRYYNYTDVLRFALLDTIPEITKTVGDGADKRTVPDTEGIEKMNAAILMIQNDWKICCESMTADHKFNLENIYNTKFNCFVRPQFDGSFQTFPGLDLSRMSFKSLYPSQMDAILRLKCMGGGIIDHEVGGGKTTIFCISAYEMKRLGLCHKPLIIGMKSNTMQIADTFRKLYPDANILYASEKEFSATNRQAFLTKIQNNNWDCIIMTHEQFKCIPQSDQTIKTVLTEELNKIDEALTALANGDISFKRAKKELEKQKQNRLIDLKNVEFRLSKQRDDVVDFKSMNIDHLFCDESHKFKNTSIKTKHTRVAGIGNTTGSDRALNLKFAIRTIQERNNSDLGATFVSGTTIVNSLTELYSLFDYLRPRALEKQGIMSFDAWASIYTNKTKEIEFSVTNELKLKERFREFLKVPELAMFYAEITDFKTAESIGLDRPEKNEILISLEQTPEQREMYDRLKKFAKTGDGSLIFRKKMSTNEIAAKMLIATNTARKASMDLRLIDDTMFSAESSNRTQAVADKAFEYYTKYHAQKGTQFIFSDIGVHKGDDTFSIYGDIKQKLIEKGIPEHEVQFIQDFNSERQRDKLFNQVNNGEVRILMGSTEKLGTGVNAQERCVAIHHVNIPWTPKDFEQRNGRGIRTGNRVAKHFANNKVDVLIYATKETLDVYQLNLVMNKAHFISQIKNQNIAVRQFDEGGMDERTGMSYSDYIAVLSGNTELLEKSKIEREIMQYKSEERVYLDSGRNRDLQIQIGTDELNKTTTIIELFQQDLNAFKNMAMDKDGFPVSGATVGTKTYKDAKNFGDAINNALDTNNRDTMNYIEIGSYENFKLVMKGEKMFSENKHEIFTNRLYVQGNLKYQHNKGSVPRTAELAGKYPKSALDRIETILMPQYTRKKEELVKKIAAFKSVEYSFPNRDKMEQAEIRLAEIKASLEKKYGAGKASVEFSFDRQQRSNLKIQ
jgi:N12 class adenine-specific DNA methylase